MSIRHVPYHVLLYSQIGATHGPGPAMAELDPYILNMAWVKTLNMSGQCVFTLLRQSPLLDLIDPLSSHLKVFRQDLGGTWRTVFAGRVARRNWGERDAIISAFDYGSWLQRSRTAFNQKYAKKKIGSEIIAPEWALAKAADRGIFSWVTTGTIEDPLGDDGLTAITTNSEFGVSDFDRLFTFYNLAELAMANTDNSVVWEITDESPHTFNFWKNKGADKEAVNFTSPGNLFSLDLDLGDDQYVNDLATPLANPDGGIGAEYVVTDEISISTYGRLQQAVSLDTLIGITSTADNKSDQAKAALSRMLKERLRGTKLVAAMPTSPIDVFNGWSLADNLRVTIANPAHTWDFLDAHLRVVTVAATITPDHGEQSVAYLRTHP